MSDDNKTHLQPLPLIFDTINGPLKQESSLKVSNMELRIHDGLTVNMKPHLLSPDHMDKMKELPH